MNRKDEQTRIHEKNRIRDEIDAQVRHYLQQGGKIDVLSANNRAPGQAIGSVWQDLDDFSDIDQ